VKPPLTLPLIMPVTTSSPLRRPSSFQAAKRLAFSRDSRVVAEAVFDGVQRHLDIVADVQGALHPRRP
jgi:hypothetical protein